MELITHRMFLLIKPYYLMSVVNYLMFFQFFINKEELSILTKETLIKQPKIKKLHSICIERHIQKL
jgi:hypothetical protein